MADSTMHREGPLAARPGLAEIARTTTSLAWLRERHPSSPLRCVCADCEAATQRARLLAAVNAGAYEAEDDGLDVAALYAARIAALEREYGRE